MTKTDNITESKKKRKVRESAGITLIALFITIVILLILAGITITAILDNNGGVISQAENAKELTRISAIQEKIYIWKLSKEKTAIELIDELEQNGLLTNEEAQIAKEEGILQIGNKILDFEVANFTMAFEQNNITLIKGRMQTIMPKILDKSGNEIPESDPRIENIELKWTSSNEIVMGIENGQVNGKTNGTAVLTCTLDGNEEVTASCNINISDGSEIYGLGKNLEHIAFQQIPVNSELEVWTRYTGIHQPTDHYNYAQSNAPQYTISNSETLADVGAYTYVYYRLKDSFNNYSDYRYFYVDQLCFVKDTEISTPNGLKKIQDIKVGDIVYSRNMNENKVEEKEVLQTFSNKVDYETTKITINNEQIECTTGHEIYTINRGWVKAAYLKEGDILLSRNNTQDIITNVETIKKEGKLDVYNFEVEGNHNYFVGSSEKLVHNPPESTCNIDGNRYDGEILTAD